MKKLVFTLLAFAVVTGSMAFSVTTSTHKKASEIFIPIGKTDKTISLADLTTINFKDFEKLSGRHLNFIDKFEFKLAQRKLRKSIDKNGYIDNKKLEKFMDEGDHSTGFHVGGFLLGFFLGLIGVLLAYVINDNDNKPNRVKWAWIGFGVSVVIALIVLISALSAL